jgi:hypothetical protein
MDANERSRKRRELVAPRPEQDSVPPPARRKRVRNELDPEMLWDKETDEPSEEFETDEEGFGDEEDEDSEGEAIVEDLDDWDHPIRRLKIN